MKATIKYKKACYVCKCKFILCCAILFFCFFSPFSIYSSEFSSELIKINKSKIDTISDNIIDSVDKQLIVLELNVGKTTPTPIDINKCEHATMAKVTIKKLSIHLDSFSHNSYWNHNNSRTKGMVDNIQTINHELDAAAYISESIEDLISYTIKEQTNSMRIARSEYTQQTLHHPEKKPDAGKI